jgi:hypothetical protein
MFFSIPRDGVEQFGNPNRTYIFPFFFPFLCCIRLLKTSFDKFTPIREVFAKWTLNKQTNVKMIVSQMKIKIE